MQEYLTAIGDALPYLLQGSLVTMALVAGAMALGLALGVVLAVGLVYGPLGMLIPMSQYGQSKVVCALDGLGGG